MSMHVYVCMCVCVCACVRVYVCVHVYVSAHAQCLVFVRLLCVRWLLCVRYLYRVPDFRHNFHRIKYHFHYSNSMLTNSNIRQSAGKKKLAALSQLVTIRNTVKGPY